jgi:PhnB protein
MIMKLVTYLIFNGTAEAAFEFYAKCLGGKITNLSRFAEAPDCGHMSADDQKRVMHVRMEVGDQILMASDSHPAMGYDGIKGCSVAIQTTDPDQAERFFNALKEGAEIRMPLGQTFWSERFGMLTDKFGAEWMVNCEKAPA